MKIIVTHASPDWDAITSVWFIKRFLPGWAEAKIEFVPAGQRFSSTPNFEKTVIETVGKDEIIHVDTGMGPLDHHQTNDMNTSAAMRAYEFSIHSNPDLEDPATERLSFKKEALHRIAKVVVAIDHFQEVYWPDSTADHYEFSLLGVLDGLKLLKPNQDDYYVELGLTLLDAVLHNFENRIWAEHEIASNGKKFTTKWGKGIGFEILNDDVLKLAQKMGYTIVVRKDPRKGYVRIKAKPLQRALGASSKEKDVDLTLVYEQLSKMDPDATWFLHVSKKMLLNGTPKNPKMIPTKLTLNEIIKVLTSL